MRDVVPVGRIRRRYRWLSAVAPGIAAARAAALYATPLPRAPASRWPDRLRPRRTMVPIGGEPIAVWTFGTGPKVLLCHAWGGRAASLRAVVGALVAAGFAAVAFDGPAHGASSRRQTDLTTFALAAEGVACAAGGVAAAIGHGFGAGALIHALHAGFDVGASVLVAPMTSTERCVDRFVKYLELDPQVGSLVKRRILPAAKVGAVAPPAIPTLVLHDRRDREVPIVDSIELVECWPRAQLLTTRGLGHRRIVHDPDAIAQMVRFLSARTASGS